MIRVAREWPQNHPERDLRRIGATKRPEIDRPNIEFPDVVTTFLSTTMASIQLEIALLLLEQIPFI